MDILELARQALKRMGELAPRNSCKVTIEDEAQPTRCEKSELSEITCPPVDKRVALSLDAGEKTGSEPGNAVCCGWVRYQRRGWQRIFGPYAKWLVQLGLEDYMAFIGDAAIDSVILPEGKWPLYGRTPVFERQDCRSSRNSEAGSTPVTRR
jgi:hypothetical protein